MMLGQCRLLTLLSLVILSEGCSPSKHDGILRSGGNERTIHTPTIHHDSPLTDPDISIDPHCDCGFCGFGMVQTVPYCTTDTCGTMHVDLSSACVRCSMCVAVAEKVHERPKFS